MATDEAKGGLNGGPGTISHRIHPPQEPDQVPDAPPADRVLGGAPSLRDVRPELDRGLAVLA